MPKKSPSHATPPHPFPRAGFLRRIAAMIYDTLMSLAVGMCAAMVMLVVMILLLENGVLDKQGFAHSSEVILHSMLYKGILQAWVAAWVIGFFVWFWCHGGQTIGMRAWRLRLFSLNDKPLGYGRALLRLVASLGGLGTLLVLLDIKHKQSLQDRIARTEMLVLTKEANHHKAWKNIQS